MNLYLFERTLGNVLKGLRKSKGFTAEDIAEKLFVGQTTISNMELAKNRIDVIRLVMYCQAIEVNWIDAVHLAMKESGFKDPYEATYSKEDVLQAVQSANTKLDKLLESH